MPRKNHLFVLASDFVHLLPQLQYTSIAFGQRCERAGVRPSTGQNCYDNALCESFFATLDCELIKREGFASHAEARMAIFTFIEGWYNPQRRRSALDYHAPLTYEKLHQERLAAASC